METVAKPAATDNLRQSLRGATAQAHDLLDNAMQEASGWTKKSDYARFLTLQYAARAPVEKWLNLNAGRGFAPPPQSPLIADDLRALNLAIPPVASDFALDERLMREHASSATLGAVWVLAGSALGNRAILGEIKRAACGAPSWPHTFLGDEAMLTFWKSLRRQIERPAGAAEMNAASAAAAAVFDHFLAAAAPDNAPSASERVPAEALL